jgi:hypothetical protein
VDHQRSPMPCGRERNRSLRHRRLPQNLRPVMHSNMRAPPGNSEPIRGSAREQPRAGLSAFSEAWPIPSSKNIEALSAISLYSDPSFSFL